MKILVTGGAGYIGSHTCVELLNKGYDVVVVDNFSNSHPEALQRVRNITGRDFESYKTDIINRKAMDAIFSEHDFDAVIHFAGFKAAGESVTNPLLYYLNNVTGTLILSAVMEKHGVHRLVFSSSAAVYGRQERMPLTETDAHQPESPYGKTKSMIEEMLQDMYLANMQWSIAMLRYFNPAGAHSSGLIGEDPNGTPTNLVPYISQTAIGKQAHVSVFGSDYPTSDGTGVRDFIHVCDLANGHLHALEKVLSSPGINAYNLGTGKGTTVLEMIKMYSKTVGFSIPYMLVPRRAGDTDICFADPAKAEQELSWKARLTVEDMCRDAWRWQVTNPQGYSGQTREKMLHFVH
ncbi:UDP-glucose 4-epimerase GalE [Alteribacillus sp. HJP-4]|uniref:UDP-glucose 4-epimerase GalE n=1 Tax=Alteribacillus sp. HJP-4 TaxID=2775394 RepID=UPI0035CD1C55